MMSMGVAPSLTTGQVEGGRRCGRCGSSVVVAGRECSSMPVRCGRAEIRTGRAAFGGRPGCGRTRWRRRRRRVQPAARAMRTCRCACRSRRWRVRSRMISPTAVTRSRSVSVLRRLLLQPEVLVRVDAAAEVEVRPGEEAQVVLREDAELEHRDARPSASRGACAPRRCRSVRAVTSTS